MNLSESTQISDRYKQLVDEYSAQAIAIQAELYDTDQNLKAIKSRRKRLEQQFVHIQGQIAALQYVQKLGEEDANSKTKPVEQTMEASDTAQ